MDEGYVPRPVYHLKILWNGLGFIYLIYFDCVVIRPGVDAFHAIIAYFRWIKVAPGAFAAIVAQLPVVEYALFVFHKSSVTSFDIQPVSILYTIFLTNASSKTIEHMFAFLNKICYNIISKLFRR